MASAGHVYGKPIIGAEAFTATDSEKWLSHPGNIKDLGDWAFCEGINRFVFHRYAMQPWPDRRPGMSMGPWGLHYERTQTWWQQSKPWHEYLARCQFLLQQGRFVADICFLGPEGSPQTLNGQPSFVSKTLGEEGQPLERPGHNFDTCPPEVVLTRMSVKDGRLVLPDGMSYHDASAIEQDQGPGGGRGRRGRIAPGQVAQLERLSGLRCGSPTAHQRTVGAGRATGGNHRAGLRKGAALLGRHPAKETRTRVEFAAAD
jgi:hypothetical protein